jgi:hypothetical protein
MQRYDRDGLETDLLVISTVAIIAMVLVGGLALFAIVSCFG